MTPTQLRAYAAVVRHGSVKAAAAEIGVTEAAVSLHVGQLRKELGDRLFVRSASGLGFTPGGLRLASRAVELLGLQERTILEVRQAGAGRRLLRLGSTGMFAEHAAPGLIGVFAERAQDLDVELSIVRAKDAEQQLASRTIDAAVSTVPTGGRVSCELFLRYQVVALVAPGHLLTHAQPGAALLRQQTWLLGPAATEPDGVVASMLGRLKVPDDHQRIYQSTAAALEQAKRGDGITLAPAFAVSQALADGSLERLEVPSLRGDGAWYVSTLPGGDAPSAAAELARFVTTTRATQAMLRQRGSSYGRFRPTTHVTLWS